VETTQLLARLDAIGRSIAATDRGLALIGLGSVGVERERLDRYSDLDFFVIAKDGCKSWFLDQLNWLETIAPLAYAFRNTVDGYKALFADGIFCEFAIFERVELSTIPFSQGRLVWHDPQVDQSIATPLYNPNPGETQTVEWRLGEALSNLYIGLGRYHRGEKLSAMYFIQRYAVDQVLALAEQIEAAQATLRDRFAPERRYEQHFPALAQQLPLLMQGYERSPESALAILDFLAAHFTINQAIADAIRQRCDRHTAQ
jgi:lincosamide nucleotidyltransferase B/F